MVTRAADMFDYWALTLFMALSLNRDKNNLAVGDKSPTVLSLCVTLESGSDFITILSKETPFTRLRM